MFEIRVDEDDIKPGDILILREWDGEKYTGSMMRREVTAVLRDCPEYGLMPGYCILSLQVPGWNHVSLACLDGGMEMLRKIKKMHEFQYPNWINIEMQDGNI